MAENSVQFLHNSYAITTEFRTISLSNGGASVSNCFPYQWWQMSNSLGSVFLQNLKMLSSWSLSLNCRDNVGQLRNTSCKAHMYVILLMSGVYPNQRH